MLLDVFHCITLSLLDDEAVILDKIETVVPFMEGRDEVGAHYEGEVVGWMVFSELFHEIVSRY